ncbi:sigma-54 interaction domain-containing protein [Oceanobacillus halophilus]|uniref:PAS domain-containing protein n=1 Tax=Oceanobacillus halophilus TaxID=930130 RepID=A0A494ZW43_9BACI|nr:sigma 54-interacting transcriptional regulator [Oceanobacillus halophilus]RKQ30507.1 PAS domain-containing protein [Oceanobacillus halophilus]
MDTFYLQAILSAEDDAITIINHNKEVLFWNDAAVHTYNIQKSDILNHKITDFFHNEDLMVLNVLETKESVKNTYHRPRHDKHVVINASPVFNKHHQLIGAVSIERDITKIVKLNENLVTTSAELSELRQKVYTSKEESPFSEMKGNSHALQQTIQIAKKAATTDATALVLGESGTGKEICARAIHEASNRKNGPFIPVNCGAIPSALFESELFGYEGGAFTGAEKKGKAGKIEMAEGGTLFLDEVGELPLEMQVKLLRVLQENEIYRIGDSKGKKVNVRFIAATNQNLELLMEQKQFRSDLYYRLNVIQIQIPPLRDRIEDIPKLSRLFLQQFSTQYQTPIPTLEDSALQVLFHYDWPGNIRELRNLIQRIVILSEKAIITEDDIYLYFQHSKPISTNSIQSETGSLPKEKESIEKQLIVETLQQLNGNKSATAKKLGISRVTLYNKLKKYNI